MENLTKDKLNDQQKQILNRFKKMNSNSEESKKFCEDKNANELICSIKRYPHAFVLACIMNRGMNADRVWQIPYKIEQEVGSFEISKLKKIEKKEYIKIFNKRFEGKKFHRYPNEMAKNFYKAVERISDHYKSDASKIWKGNSTSGDIILRFMEFEGVGVKIATMAANILTRSFKVPIRDRHCIDISPDVHVMRVFERQGFIREGAKKEELQYFARNVCPEYPGVYDLGAWKIGEEHCVAKEKEIKCEGCDIKLFCQFKGKKSI